MPPAQQVLQMTFAYSLSRCVYVAARLGIADLLAGGRKTADELAAATKSDADALYRMLRALASNGVFIETEARVFGLTPLAETLRDDAPDSIRAVVLFWGDHMHESVYAELEYSVRTGKRSFDHVFGRPPFEYLKDHPEDAAVFNRAMSSFSSAQIPAVVEAYDFGRFGSVADIGGGLGHLLRGILNHNPGLKGILFDLPETVSHAKDLPADRCSIVSGSFFESVPAADAYVLKHIIHDWDDGSARCILENCRRSISPNGRLLTIEMILPPMNEPGFAKLLDIEMLLLPGGRERTVDEFRALYAASAFELTEVIPTRSPVAIIEGRPI
ncbi:MAG TPA: methyltransferase [Bryobacteraceae bacterium]|nr:methyltransferase [Bryobacteraceae bacterium]